MSKDKKCIVFETLNSVHDLKVDESKSDGLMRLSGVFGVAGIRNDNNRIYDKANYGQMVEALQHTIDTVGCPGELEHPNSMNIDLNNVSHKIESIQMNEDGTITGTICLLNTPKGKIAQAIVEGGLPLYISSRASGTITNEGRVTLATLKTYDLVGTPGFSQAQLNLDKNQKFENLNESLDDENTNCWAIVTEGGDLLGSDDDDKKDKKKDKDKDKGDDLLGSDDDDKKKDDKKDNSDDLLGSDDDDKKKDDKTKKEPKKEEPKKEEPKDEPEKEGPAPSDDKPENSDNSNKENDSQNTQMEDIKKSIDELTERINSLEASLHIAKESLADIKPVNYNAIQSWIEEEYTNTLTDKMLTEANKNLKEKVKRIVNRTIDEAIDEAVAESQKNVMEAVGNGTDKYLTEQILPKIQSWLTDEYTPEHDTQIAEGIQNWCVKEFAPSIQGWLTDEYSQVLEKWVNNEAGKQISESIISKVNDKFQKQDTARLENIDSLLESIEKNKDDVNEIVKEEQEKNKYMGIYCIAHMPAEYKPLFEGLSEDRKNEIIRQSRMYDFTKNGVLESFWAGIDFNKAPEQPVNEQKGDVINDYQSMIAAQMKRFRH